jgi:hypothetical protein
MAASADSNPLTTVLVPGYDPTGHQSRVALHMTNVTIDNTVNPPITYGDIVTSPGSGTQTVNGTVAVSSVIPGTGATNLGKAQGTTYVSSDVGTLLLGISGDGSVLLTSGNGKYSPILCDQYGIMQTTPYGIRDYDTGLYITRQAGLMTIEGSRTLAIAASTAANTVVSTNKGYLFRVLVTVTGTNQMNIYDNTSSASGTIIGLIPANASPGQVFEFKMTATQGITVAGNANNPGVTISYT